MDICAIKQYPFKKGVRTGGVMLLLPSGAQFGADLRQVST